MDVSTLNIPKYLKPVNEKEDTQSPMDFAALRDMTVEQTNRAFEAVGLARINGDQAKALRDLGIHARALGILETMQGTVLVSQQALTSAIAVVANKISDDGLTNKALVDLGKVMGYLGGQLAKVNSSAIKSENIHVENRIAQDKNRRVSFPAGRAVGPIIDVK